MKVAPSGRIKVTIVINDLLIGGAQKLVIDLLARLDRTRFEPTLITFFQFGHDELYDSLPSDIPVHKLTFRSIRDIRAWLSLVRTMYALHPSVVLSSLFFSNTVMRVLAPFFRYRTIISEQNTYTGKTKFEQRVDRLLSFITYRIVAVSKTVASFTATQERIKSSKFVVIYNGVDTERIRREACLHDASETRRSLGFVPSDRVIMNIARLLPQKNQQLMLTAFAAFVAKHPQYHLVLVGDGKSRAELERLVGALGIRTQVHFLGYRHDIPQLLSIADFFLSTSLIEGFSVAYAEALACGVPVLTTKTAGSDEMIEEGKNGFFISAYRPEAVVEGMEKIIACNLALMHTAARETAEKYSIEHAVSSYEILFIEAIRGKSKDTP